MDAASETQARIQELMDAPEEESTSLGRLEFAVGRLLGRLREISKKPNGDSIISRAETFIRWWTKELEDV